MSIKVIESGTVADAYLALLADRGLDYLFANAGTDFAPIIEAYAKAQVNGTKVPKPVTVSHENVAIAMAQGYCIKTGRPQAVMVHANAAARPCSTCFAGPADAGCRENGLLRKCAC